MFVVGASYLKKILRDRILPRFVQDEGLQYAGQMSQYSVVVIGILFLSSSWGWILTSVILFLIGWYRFWSSEHYL